MDIKCVEVNMDNITLSRNTMTSRSSMIRFNDFNIINGHIGSYIYYDGSNTSPGSDEIILTDMYFNGGDSYFIDSDYGMIHIYGTISRISSIELLFNMITFDSNTGRMILVNNYDTNDGGVDLSNCPNMQ